MGRFQDFFKIGQILTVRIPVIEKTYRKILFGSISSRPIHFMKAGMLLHLLGSTDCVTTKKQHIETHLNQGVEFSY